MPNTGNAANLLTVQKMTDKEKILTSIMPWAERYQVYYNLMIWRFLEITVLSSLKVILEMKQIKRS